MRIRTVFLACFTAVAVHGVVVATWLAVESWARWQHADIASAAMHALSDAQRAQTALPTELGQMLTAALSPTTDLPALDRTAQLTDTLIEAIRRSAIDTGLDPRPAQDALEALSGFRRRLRPLLMSPPPERDPAFVKDILASRTELGTRLATVAQAALRRVVAEAPALASTVEIAVLAMDMREYAGHRNLMMTGWIGKDHVPAAELILADQLSGRVTEAWAAARRSIDGLGDDPALTGQRARQVADYERNAEPHWQRLLGLARGAGPIDWPEDLKTFRAWSVPAQADILRLRDTALDRALADAATMAATARLHAIAALALLICGLALSLASAVTLLQRVLAPLQNMTGAVERIAAGELRLAIPGQDRRDELGKMGAAIETLRTASLAREDLSAARALEQQARTAQAERINALLQAFEAEAASMLHTVADAAAELDTTARVMTETARDGAGQANSVAAAADQASANVQTVASATEQLSASIAEVARQVSESAVVARRATDNARETDQAVQGLATAALRIGEVVQLISGIATQTNLLALNATIEAARAGEAGKGFAVVASEVKTLAGQTARATEDIRAQIDAMQHETTRTVQAIGAIGRIIEQIDGGTAAVAVAASQQAAATQEIGRAVAEAASGTQDAARHAAGVRDGAKQTGASANSLRTAATTLAHQAAAMRTQVNTFLNEVRAA